MEEGPSNTVVTELPPEPAPAVAIMEAPIESQVPVFPPLRLAELQEMSPAALQEWFAAAEVRPHPGRNRHQQILDLVRAAVARGQTVTTSGFLEQPNDGPAILRSPRYNFLPLPEDVGVPHFLIRQFGLRPGQALRGTIRPPRDREKSMMLDRILTIEKK